MVGGGRIKNEALSSRYLPEHIEGQLENISWESIFEMGKSHSASIAGKGEKARRLEKEMNMACLFLMEKIRDKKGAESIEPQLLVDTVRLMQKSQAMACEYELDLEKFNSFLNIILQKLKKHKMERHDGDASAQYRSMSPLSEKIEKYKEKTERKPKNAKKGQKTYTANAAKKRK